MNSSSKITDAELEIMQVVWDCDNPISFRDICETLQNRSKKVTIQTLISRLVDKGALKQEKHDVYYYSALGTRQEYEQAKTEELINKVYRGDVKKLFAALMDSEPLSKEDMVALRKFWQGVNGDA